VASVEFVSVVRIHGRKKGALQCIDMHVTIIGRSAVGLPKKSFLGF